MKESAATTTSTLSLGDGNGGGGDEQQPNWKVLFVDAAYDEDHHYDHYFQ